MSYTHYTSFSPTPSTSDDPATYTSAPSSPRPSSSADSSLFSPITPSFPPHPLPAFRSAFTESILDTLSPLQRPSTPQHPASTKLLAQISFGLHLLHTSTSRSEREVVRILQVHINDLDRLLSSAGRELSAASTELSDRTRTLRDPPDGIRAAAKRARTTLRRLDRRLPALHPELDGVLDGADLIAGYLLRADPSRASAAVDRVFAAMRWNVEMWFRCAETLMKRIVALQAKLDALKSMLVDIGERGGVRGQAVREMARAAVADPFYRPPVDTNKPLPRPPSHLHHLDLRRSSTRKSPAPPPPPPPPRGSRKKRKPRPPPLDLARTQHPRPESGLRNAREMRAELERRGRTLERDGMIRLDVRRARSAPSVMSRDACLRTGMRCRERLRVGRKPGKAPEEDQPEKTAAGKEKRRGAARLSWWGRERGREGPRTAGVEGAGARRWW